MDRNLQILIVDDVPDNIQITMNFLPVQAQINWRLHGDLQSHWQQAQKTNHLTDIRLFAAEIAQLARDTECDAHDQYASKLYGRVDAFYVGNIAFLLNQYPQLQRDLNSASLG